MSLNQLLQMYNLSYCYYHLQNFEIGPHAWINVFILRRIQAL